MTGPAPPPRRASASASTSTSTPYSTPPTSPVSSTTPMSARKLSANKLDRIDQQQQLKARSASASASASSSRADPISNAAQSSSSRRPSATSTSSVVSSDQPVPSDDGMSPSKASPSTPVRLIGLGLPASRPSPARRGSSVADAGGGGGGGGESSPSRPPTSTLLPRQTSSSGIPRRVVPIPRREGSLGTVDNTRRASNPSISISHPTPPRISSRPKSRPTSPTPGSSNSNRKTSAGQVPLPIGSHRTAYHTTTAQAPSLTHENTPEGSHRRPSFSPRLDSNGKPRSYRSSQSSRGSSPSKAPSPRGSPRQGSPSRFPANGAHNSILGSDHTPPPKSSRPQSSPTSKEERRVGSSVITNNAESPNGALPSSKSLAGSPRSSPKVSSRPPASRSSPRPDRKPLGLTINPPPLPPNPYLDLGSISRTPPVPAKSPLRQLSQTGPFVRPKRRVGSTDSSAAVVGTPKSEEGEAKKADVTDTTASSTVSTPSTSSERTTSSSPTADARFSSLTYPSMYSQDSAPPTASSWIVGVDSIKDAMTPESEGVASGQRRESRIDSFGWGKKREGSLSSTTEAISVGRRKSSLPKLDLDHKELPEVPMSLTPIAMSPLKTPTTPDRHFIEQHRQIRSPSMPVLGGSPQKVIQLAPGAPSPKFPRSHTGPIKLLPAASLHSGPLSPSLQLSSSTLSLSKRAHLLREIANTERAHANDLALIRDAYVGRYTRPSSTHSTGDPGISPGLNDSSRRSSFLQASDLRRSSGHDSLDTPWTSVWGAPLSPARVSPANGHATDSGYFTGSTAASSSTSIQTPQPSPRVISAPPSMTVPGRMGPPIGRPLHASDVKTVFLNIDQLATISDELATAFEDAMDDEVAASEVGRAGEGGNDKLGEVFTQMLPRLRPLYMYYCARQSQASTRLLELQADSGYAAHLNDCWSRVKSRTHAWNLDSMLIKPVQRVTKYPLLFDDLLACTTPVHVDYFMIRAASEGARALAMEIDEAKRRKDIISNVISKKPMSSPSLSRDSRASASSGKLLGLKRFKKDKSPGPGSASPVSDPSAPPPDIPAVSQALLKDLAAKLEDGDLTVRRVGKEILNWTASAKLLVSAEHGILNTLLQIYTLDGLAPIDPKADTVLAFKATLTDIASNAWEDLNEEVCNSVMLSLGKLLDSARNPRTVITKRDSKASDYARYLSTRQAKKPVDRVLQQSAADFVAMHTQLVEELPAFLEGFMRILDMTMVAFAHAQAKFHSVVRDRLLVFTLQHMSEPKKRSPKLPVVNLDEDPIDLSTGRGIVRAWYDAWHPYDHAMESFDCTRTSRLAASRVASFKGNRPPSRSGAISPRPGLRHTPSMTSNRSTTDHTDDSTGRRRSASLMNGQVPVSPVKTRFGLLRRNSQTVMKNNNSSRSTASLVIPSNGVPKSVHSTPPDDSDRHSFGLPQISTDDNRLLFEGLGLSPTKVTTPLVPAAGTGRRSSDHYQDTRMFTGISALSSSPIEENVGLGVGDVPRRDVQRVHHPFATAPPTPPAPRVADDIDASEGWKQEKVLYQCACVADFQPSELGNKRYRGLRFLPMVPGDLVDVFHEVGRIDELPHFPYADVGVENDGVLIGRAEDGAIGLVICSFLEPLRD